MQFLLKQHYICNRKKKPHMSFNTLFFFFCPRRYDSFTGMPVCQQNISLEKASMLFNMAALYSQIGTRADRQTQAGLENAIAAFQKSAGERF